MPVSLKFGTLKDFRPESIARQVPELRNLLELRDAMKALRPKMGDKAAQKELLKAIKDPAVRDKIVAMIATPQAPAETPAPASEAGGGEASQPAPPADSPSPDGETPPS